MRRLLRFLKSFWLLSFALWLAAVVLCVWWIPRLGGGPQRLAIAVALLTAIWLLAIVLRKYRQVRAERDLEELVQLEVNREAASVASQASDYEVLRERLKSALGMLKARGGRGGTLSELPWYLVVGHSASGKTSLLTRSGLNTGVAGLGAESGTQYCDWYFGSDAVLVDTAGRYIAEEQPAQEFANFLRLLARRRRRKPINGLVVVIDLPELLRAPREDNHALAQQLIERINEYHKALGSAPPVYLCFSKADLLPGFIEAFHSLDSTARQTPWGMTFPVADIRGKGLGESFARRFAPMVEALRAHVDRQVVEEGRNTTSALLRFPDYVAEIHGRLTDFLEPFDLRHNPDTAPLTRGLYFTSALQQGEGLEAIIDVQTCNTFALTEGAAERPVSRARSDRSYFIQGLFRDVLIADRNLVQHYSRNGRRQGSNLWMVGVAGLVGIGVLALLGHSWWLSYKQGQQLDEQLDAVVDASDSDRLSMLNEQLVHLKSEEREGLAAWQNAGLGIDDDLRPAVEQVWMDAMRDQVLTPLGEDLGRRLAEVGALATSLGLDNQIEVPVSEDETGDSGMVAGAMGEGRNMVSESGDRMRDRLTSRPSLGSIPRSPGELAGRVRGELDYRVRGSANDAFWSARQQGRDALREGARDAWRNGLSDEEIASSAFTHAGPAFTDAALNRLEPTQVADLIDAYDVLKLYLVLSNPEAHADQSEFVSNMLPRAWQHLSDRSSRVPGERSLIADNVALYSDYLAQGKAPAIEPDERLIAQARADLKSFLVNQSPADREYLRLRLLSEEQFPPLTLADILPEAGQPMMYAGEAVPAFFTHRVWEEFVRPELAKTLASDIEVERDWVLEGDSSLDEVQGKAQFASEVLGRYKSDYVYAWERFIADVGVRRFDDLSNSRAHLTQLSDYQRSPLKVLLQVVNENTNWDSREAKQRQAESAGEEGEAGTSESQGFWQGTLDWVSGDEAADKVALLSDMPPIHDGFLAYHFEPVSNLFSTEAGAEGDSNHMDQYLLLLRQLKARLDSLERGDLGKRTKQLMEDVIGGNPNEITAVRNYVAANIDTSRDELVQSIQSLFRDPVEFSVASLDGPIAEQLAAAWSDQIATPWQSMVNGRYPVSDSSNEASVRDLRQFVDPQSGLLVTFDEKEVGNLDEAGGEGEPLVDPSITATIAEGTSVGRVLESLADVENGFEIMIQPASNFTSIELTLDGQQQQYRNGPQSWERFTWPGDERQAGARLEVVTFGGQRVTVFDFPSRWGLLKLIDSADVTNLDAVRQRFTWYTSMGPVSLVARNFGGVKLTDLKQVRRLRIPTPSGAR
ncbi:type VI secretion protein IcmF/TssM N-terminal domain-containing protein [Halomonas huangheensis]|uniref:ImcF-like protein n=1 Tax=Halomonas huangheensis TaxID=1178482 RepID=W1NAU9_9GAMM|nr:type VI secretion protein IcmF/TssM N-terminal domain-containing protein [Halomonas huangheensis]ALM53984.1 hypothetical protein AR456_18180 [Halomonas huangheensis]ERL52055.1 hypothetical protein BJB45_08820 [Halomonas huangheensis]